MNVKWLFLEMFVTWEGSALELQENLQGCE